MKLSRGAVFIAIVGCAREPAANVAERVVTVPIAVVEAGAPPVIVAEAVDADVADAKITCALEGPGGRYVRSAPYLVEMHRRIHPLYVDRFLASLDAFAPDHPLNDMRLVTTVEVVLMRDGRIEKMGIVKSSGVTEFDLGALDALDRAGPFYAAPSDLVSANGRVYVDWEFHRDACACAAGNATSFVRRADGTSGL